MLILMSDSVICLPWSDYFRSFLGKKKKRCLQNTQVCKVSLFIFLVMKFNESAGNSAHTTITVCFPQKNYYMI